jgi:hypothetical protein
MSARFNQQKFNPQRFNQQFVDTVNIMNDLIDRASTSKSSAFLNHVLTKTEMALESMSKLKMNDDQRLFLQTVEWKFTVFKAELYLDYLSFIINDDKVILTV